MTPIDDGGASSMWCPNQECPDALESGSPAEFVQGMITCPFCGAALTSYMPAWADPAASEVRLVPVLPVVDNSWLPQLKALLDAGGIPFLVADSKGGSGFDPVAGAPVVMVKESDAERAAGLLRDFREQAGLAPTDAPPELSPPARQPSSCSQCGKALESGEGDEPLAYCYHCGAPLSSGATDG